MSAEKRWLAIYTKPRWEKKVFRLLADTGVEVYCPLNKVRRKWSDRIKLVEEPLFKSYVFVRISKQQEDPVKLISGVLNFVYWLGKPAVINPKDIERIKRFLKEYSDVEALAMQQLTPNSRVIITSGVLMDKEARIISTDKKRVELEIESMGYKLVAYVDRKHVIPVTKTSKK